MKNVVAQTKMAQIMANINDDGRNGKVYEGSMKIALNGFIRGSKVVSSNKQDFDLTSKNIKIECKTGCGEIDSLLKHYQNNDNVIVKYSPTAELNDTYTLTCYDFINVLSELNLIRTKRATNGRIVKSIQSFKNSKKRYSAFRELLAQYNID